MHCLALLIAAHRIEYGTSVSLPARHTLATCPALLPDPILDPITMALPLVFCRAVAQLCTTADLSSRVLQMVGACVLNQLSLCSILLKG